MLPQPVTRRHTLMDPRISAQHSPPLRPSSYGRLVLPSSLFPVDQFPSRFREKVEATEFSHFWPPDLQACLQTLRHLRFSPFWEKCRCPFTGVQNRFFHLGLGSCAFSRTGFGQLSLICSLSPGSFLLMCKHAHLSAVLTRQREPFSGSHEPLELQFSPLLHSQTFWKGGFSLTVSTSFLLLFFYRLQVCFPPPSVHPDSSC